jgi:hypothetical protein
VSEDAVSYTISDVASGLLGNDIATNGVLDPVDVPGLALAADGTFVYTSTPTASR